MEEIIIRKGIMVKSPGKMTALELKDWKHKSYQRAKDYLFSIGQPLVYYLQDGTPVAEYFDGRIERLQ
ncbi:hypothetical protein [Dyadobacter sp. NIV53]|uniref:hypothetical protein n=1 Tax=Dyadobacter sp. NIV53 TaxID=2861765 RepID=UPI001C877256|nr:hypothetical protein [Dyadobacter sp. NIV53]